MNKLFYQKSVYLNLIRRASSSLQASSENLPKKLPFKKPFIKNLIAGVYVDDFLVYPELTSEKVKIAESKYLAFPKEFSNFRESLNALATITEASSLDSDLDSKDNTLCELTRLSEAISTPSLSILTEIQNICVQDIISKYCTEDQKSKYLPRLLKGETSVAFALSEEVCGSDPASICTTGLRNRETSLWSINGVKTWITNAESADLFLVFSKFKLHEKSFMNQELSVFIIEKKTPGVKIEKIHAYGLEECGIGKLILDNVQLTDDCLVGKVNNNGYKIAVELLRSYKYSYAAFFSSMLKNLLNDTIKFITPRKQSLTNLKDCESIMKKLSDVFLTIYSLDSMLYLTSGLKDHFDIDLDLEAGIIHLFCIQNGMEAVDKCMEMLGSKVFDKSFPYYKLRNDLKASTNVFHTKDLCKFYVALTGIQGALDIMKDDVKTLRNSLNYPYSFIKGMVNEWKHSKDSPKLNLKLHLNLHPSLKFASEELEYCVLRLQHCIQKLLVNHGNEMFKRQLDLERISDILVDIYSMTSVLGRSSRAYCTGIQFADDEILAAKTVCCDATARVKFTVNRMLSDDTVHNDLFHIKVSEHLYNHRGYFFRHPLTQNID